MDKRIATLAKIVFELLQRVEALEEQLEKLKCKQAQ